MKKKALFSSILSVVIAAGACVGFAACKDNTPTGSGESVKEVDKITADTDPEWIFSEKVSESEWNSALESSSFTNVSLKRISSIVKGSFSAADVDITENDGNKVHRTLGIGVNEIERYYQKKNNKYYVYYENVDGKKIEAEDTSAEAADNFKAESVQGLVCEYTALLKFSDFTYSEAVKSYKGVIELPVEQVVTPGSSRTYATATVPFNAEMKFLGGKLVYSSLIREEGLNTEMMSVLFYNYGTTSVSFDNTLSGISSVKGTQVSTTDWDNAFADANAGNVSAVVLDMNGRDETASVSRVYWEMADGNKVVHFDSTDGTQAIYNKSGSDWYQYHEQQGIVFKAVDDYGPEEVFKTFHVDYDKTEKLIGKFSDYTWNEAQGAYLKHISQPAITEGGNNVVVPATEYDNIVKFVGGKLAWVYDGGANKYYHFYNYGSTSVTLPTVTQSGEWANAPHATDFKLQVYSVSDGTKGAMTIFQGDRVAYVQSNVNTVYYAWTATAATGNDALAEGKLRVYTQASGESNFTYQDVDPDGYKERKNSFWVLKESDFEKEEGVYVGKTGTAYAGWAVYFAESKPYAVVYYDIYSGFRLVKYIDWSNTMVYMPTNVTAAQA